MNHALAIFAAGVIAATATPAYASWQWTEWGMTVEAVAEASGGTASPNADRGRDSDDLVASLTAPYSASNIDFTADFLFRDGGLAFVILTPDDEDCSALAGALTRAYGQSDDQRSTNFSSKRWWDHANGNFVMYISIEVLGSCSAQYSGLTDGGAPGGL